MPLPPEVWASCRRGAEQQQGQRQQRGQEERGQEEQQREEQQQASKEEAFDEYCLQLLEQLDERQAAGGCSSC